MVAIIDRGYVNQRHYLNPEIAQEGFVKLNFHFRESSVGIFVTVEGKHNDKICFDVSVWDFDG